MKLLYHMSDNPFLETVGQLAGAGVPLGIVLLHELVNSTIPVATEGIDGTLAKLHVDYLLPFVNSRLFDPITNHPHFSVFAGAIGGIYFDDNRSDVKQRIKTIYDSFAAEGEKTYNLHSFLVNSGIPFV